MAKAPYISNAVKTLVTQEALNYRNKPRRALVTELTDLVSRMGERVPSEENLERMISWARNHAPHPEDAPWALAASIKHGIPTEATPTVLRIWKLCLVRGEPLSIREAKWIAWLQTIRKDTENLLVWSRAYALRERACEALGKPCDTSDLDAALIMGQWELATARLVGTIKPFQIELGPAPYYTHTEDIEFADSSVLNLAGQTESTFMLSKGLDDPGEVEKAESELEDLQPLGHRLHTEQARWVYVHWLLHLSKGPKIKRLKVRDRLDIILGLREWVEEHPWANVRTTIDIFPIGESFPTELYKPLELLEKVGYEPCRENIAKN